jgi:hypothetical protein
MNEQIRIAKRELVELASLVEKLEQMEQFKDCYSSHEFATIEISIIQQKELLISKIEKV